MVKKGKSKPAKKAVRSAKVKPNSATLKNRKDKKVPPVTYIWD